MSQDPGRGLGLIGAIISRGFWWPEAEAAAEYEGPTNNRRPRRRPSRIEQPDMIRIEDEEIMVFL